MALDLEKTPTANTSVNKPKSGTYGEKADLARLEGQLPSSGQRVAGPPGPTAGPMPGPGVGMPNVSQGGRPRMAPSGVPGALLEPSRHPEVPVNTPLQQPAASQGPLGGAQDAARARVYLLESLSTSPEVSDETREWAKLVLEMLTND